MLSFTVAIISLKTCSLRHSKCLWVSKCKQVSSHKIDNEVNKLRRFILPSSSWFQVTNAKRKEKTPLTSAPTKEPILPSFVLQDWQPATYTFPVVPPSITNSPSRAVLTTECVLFVNSTE